MSEPDYKKIHVTFEPPGEGATLTCAGCGEEMLGPAGEWLWAEDLGGGQMKVANVPFYADGFTLGDVVRVDGEEIVEVLEHSRYSAWFLYDGEGEEDVVLERYRRIFYFFEEHDIQVEGATSGAAVACVPLEMGNEAFEELCAKCPVELRMGAGKADGE